jgi:hypothetical protein
MRWKRRLLLLARLFFLWSALEVLVWRLIADSPLGLRAATRVFFTGQIGKYIPGTVWAYAWDREAM